MGRWCPSAIRRVAGLWDIVRAASRVVLSNNDRVLLLLEQVESCAEEAYAMTMDVLTTAP